MAFLSFLYLSMQKKRPENQSVNSKLVDPQGVFV